ncbi:MAG: thiamine phosphate synthase [Bacteroidetes bacterium]|nr:thiamine phosphate synthase [Bacteroidota bacterium]
MQLIVVSSPAEIANEAAIINALFDEGLERFHLRKPDYTEPDLMRLLEKIAPENYPKIAFHQLHSAALKNGFNRIHFTATAREQLHAEELEKLHANGCKLSTSIHTLTEKLSDKFDYAFYGPVFDSISKQGYKPAVDFIPPVAHHKNSSTRIIAIGGIDAVKLKEIAQAGFDGAALLGTIWHDTTKSIPHFKQCLKNVNTH